MMPREETVCKYCGVSYLIYHELKLMEDKVKVMEAEMAFYSNSVEREKKLKEELCLTNQRLEQLKTDNEQKQESLNYLNGQLANKQKELKNMSQKTEDIQGQLKEAQRQSELFRERAKRQECILQQAVSLFQGMRPELAVIREEASSNSMIWRAFSKTLTRCMEVTSSAVHTEISELQGSLKKSNQVVTFLQQEMKDLRLHSDAAAVETLQLQASAQRASEFQSRCHELQKQTLGLTNQLDTLQQNVQKVTAELEYYKELLMNKSKEADSLLSRIQQLDCAQEEIESRQGREMKEKEEECFRWQQEYNRLQEKLEENLCKEAEIQRQCSRSQNELQTLKSALKQTKGELTALMQERELMVISHQNRIEQLRENFRQKLGGEDNWREKVEEELTKERERHCKEQQELVLRMKEEARLDLDIDRQKHQELVSKYKKENKELQAKVPGLIDAATKGLQLELNSLEKELKDAQSRLMERDRSKEDQICSLGKLVSDLETRLRQEQDKMDSITQDLRKEVQQKSSELRDTQQELQQLTRELSQAQAEMTFLQETVRRECEERFELTEALGQAREQLLELKKLNGVLPLSQHSDGQPSLNSSPFSVGSQGHTSHRVLSSSTTKVSGSKGLSANPSPSNSALNSFSGCRSLPAISMPHPPKGRLSTVNEAKLLIAAAFRKK
uniref:Leucine, glutamate and lysine rich 1 n=2 Tax=Callorhinchus milii TaxID=7868 RepID=A0A4W3GCT0_CALMI